MCKTSLDEPEFVGEENGGSNRSTDTSEAVRGSSLEEAPRTSVREADARWTPSELSFAVRLVPRCVSGVVKQGVTVWPMGANVGSFLGSLVGVLVGVLVAVGGFRIMPVPWGTSEVLGLSVCNGVHFLESVGGFKSI